MWSDGVCVCVSAVLKVLIQTPIVSHTPTAAPRLTHLTHTHLLSTVWIIDWHKPYHNKPNMASECILCLNACFHLLVCVQMLSRAAHGENTETTARNAAFGHWISTGCESNYNQAWWDYAELLTFHKSWIVDGTLNVFSSFLCSRPSMQSYFSMHSVRMQIYQARPWNYKAYCKSKWSRSISCQTVSYLDYS